MTVTEAARCSCGSAFRQIETDQAITCVLCSRTIQDAPIWEPPHIEPARIVPPRGIGRRQEAVLDFIAAAPGCTSRMVGTALDLSDGEVGAAIRSLTVRHLIRRDGPDTPARWDAVG